MKVVAIYGSARKKGYSALAVNTAVEYFQSRGAEVRTYFLPEMKIQQCRGCFRCRRKEGCILQDDMTELFQEMVTCDFVIFSTPIYCFSACGTFWLMFERLYPMLAGGMALGEGKQKYTYRYPIKKCMMIFSQGAPRVMCRSSRKQVLSNLKMNGFDNLGTVIIDSTYTKKEKSLTPKQVQYIRKICEKVK